MKLSRPKIKKFPIFRMKLSCTKIKKFLIFSQKSFSYILGYRTFQELSSSKIKKFLIFPEMELSGNWREISKLRKEKNPAQNKFLVISQKKLFLYFGKMKLSYIFLKMFFLYFGKWNFPATTLETFLYFRREVQSPKLKKIFFKSL